MGLRTMREPILLYHNEFQPSLIHLYHQEHILNSLIIMKALWMECNRSIKQLQFHYHRDNPHVAMIINLVMFTTIL